jgi:ABC-type sugar transport system permease subunit
MVPGPFSCKEVVTAMAVKVVPQMAPRRRRAFSPTPIFFLGPALVTIVVLTLLPVIYSIVIAFTNYNLYTTGGPSSPG